MEENHKNELNRLFLYGMFPYGDMLTVKGEFDRGFRDKVYFEILLKS
jgi:hypothetical protein